MYRYSVCTCSRYLVSKIWKEFFKGFIINQRKCGVRRNVIACKISASSLTEDQNMKLIIPTTFIFGRMHMS